MKSPRIHYYAKAIRILNKAKQWERVRILKAMCLAYGIQK